eukprot:scaffold18840_cov101-Isochrysis_galbana.AAC.4
MTGARSTFAGVPGGHGRLGLEPVEVSLSEGERRRQSMGSWAGRPSITLRCSHTSRSASLAAASSSAMSCW